jgi:hypothetical protein
VFTVSRMLAPKVMFNYLIIEVVRVDTEGMEVLEMGSMRQHMQTQI